MAVLPAIKLCVAVACVIGSLWGLNNAELGPLKNGLTNSRLARLMRLLGKVAGGGVSSENYQHSTCQDCLHEGKDFCISESKCIPRATLNCKGPYDHITGDKEFSLHGNPEGVQHSMTCPDPTQKGDVDTKDCYFDKECHAKVDWEKIAKIKKGFFGRLKYFKEKDDAKAVKHMVQKVHQMFLEAGMPDDRIDYILFKWVKYVFPEALDKHKEVEKKDCYLDKECHAKVDWDKIGKITGDFLPRLKYFKEKNDANAVKTMIRKMHVMFQEAGMPDDRIDYILLKWVKRVFPEALEEDKEKEKPNPHTGDFVQFDICTIAKIRCMEDGDKILTGRCGMAWKKCGDELGIVV